MPAAATAAAEGIFKLFPRCCKHLNLATAYLLSTVCSLLFVFSVKVPVSPQELMIPVGWKGQRAHQNMAGISEGDSCGQLFSYWHLDPSLTYTDKNTSELMNPAVKRQNKTQGTLCVLIKIIYHFLDARPVFFTLIETESVDSGFCGAPSTGPSSEEPGGMLFTAARAIHAMIVIMLSGAWHSHTAPQVDGIRHIQRPIERPHPVLCEAVSNQTWGFHGYAESVKLRLNSICQPIVDGGVFKFIYCKASKFSKDHRILLC